MNCNETGGTSSKGGTASLISASLRAALAGGAAVAMVLAALGSADAALQRKAPQPKREQAKKEPPPKALEQPLIEISIAKQQLTVFEKGQPVVHAPVSTGMAGHLTPTGIFSVIEKEVFHRSNIYSGAPMPFMQRITWSGVAMHAGVLPGYPASHGCIRMPAEFAPKLYALTQRGARVVIMPNEVAPVPFEHAKLFVRPKPPTDKTSELVAPAAGDSKPARLIMTAQSQSPSIMSDAVDAAAHALAGMAKPKPTEAVAVAEPPKAIDPPAAPAPVAAAPVPQAPSEAAADTSKATAAVAATPANQEDATLSAPAAAEPPKIAEPPAAPVAVATTSDAAEATKDATVLPAPQAPSEAATDAVKGSAAASATEAMHEEAITAAAGAAETAPPPAKLDAPAATTEAPKVSDTNVQAGTQLAVNGGSAEATTGTVTVKPIPLVVPHPIEMQRSFAPAAPPSAAPAFVPAPAVQPATPVQAALEFYGPERPLRPGPITVFVSKKEGKVFVRKGFQPVFSWPVTFAHPEQPLGTHLFTAVEAQPDGVSFRWLLVSLPAEAAKKAEVHVTKDKKGRRIETVTQPAAVPRSATAAEALERVDIPAPALSRISSLMSTGASLIISDQGLGSETGTETDFIVLTR